MAVTLLCNYALMSPIAIVLNSRGNMDQCLTASQLRSGSWWGATANQMFMQISLLHGNNIIGCGEEPQPIRSYNLGVIVVIPLCQILSCGFES